MDEMHLKDCIELKGIGKYGGNMIRVPASVEWGMMKFTLLYKNKQCAQNMIRVPASVEWGMIYKNK
jgi:hypothetical protein